MTHLLQIHLAVMLAFPMGLFEHPGYGLECSNSTCMLEEADSELLELAAAAHSDPQNVFLESMCRPGLACSVTPCAPETDLKAVDIGCIQLEGCRPPPIRQRPC